MPEQHLRPLPLRTESDFFRENKSQIFTQPYAVKSEMQSVEPQLFGPEYQHYEILKQRFDLLCNWIKDNLGFEVSQEQKDELLKKIYIVSPKKLSQFAQEGHERDFGKAVAFIDGMSNEMVIQDCDLPDLSELLWRFNHESIHLLSLTKYTAQLATRGHSRYYGEDITRLGVSRFYGNKQLFNALNEVSTEMLNLESLGALFPNNEVFEAPQYVCLMVFAELLMLDLASKSSGKHDVLSLRHQLYIDMLDGGSEFFVRMRSEYGGSFVRAFARVSMSKPQELYEELLELTAFFGIGARRNFQNKMNDFSRNKPVQVMNKFIVKQMPEND